MAEPHPEEATPHELRQERICRIIEAVEAFVDASISYERSSRKNPEWASSHNLNEARTSLERCLMADL